MPENVFSLTLILPYKDYVVEERWNSVFKGKKVTNFALNLENKPEIIREFVFHYGICSLAYLKRQFT